MPAYPGCHSSHLAELRGEDVWGPPAPCSSSHPFAVLGLCFLPLVVVDVLPKLLPAPLGSVLQSHQHTRDEWFGFEMGSQGSRRGQIRADRGCLD